MTFTSARLRLLTTLVLALAFCACGKSSHEYLAEARQDLAAGSYADAVAAAESGLAGSPDDVTAWGLEIVILEAHARAGSGAATKAQLLELAGSYEVRISATDYSSTAQLLQAADEKAVAIEVLDLGIKRFPEDAMLTKMIADSVATGGDPAELEMLRSLGYIE